jgi:hypothetical protein
MTWPNHSAWSAERNNEVVETEDGIRFTWVVPCGSLYLPSGRLVACDPFAFLRPGDNPYVFVPTGHFPVTVTLADVSPNLDRSHIREAYATVRFAEGIDSHRRVLPLLREGERPPELKEGEFIGFRVDAGTACFVDDRAVASYMPPVNTWYDDLFENGNDDCWFKRMDDPNHLREGLANIVLPLSRNGENIVIVHSGWGDGTYPVVGSFDSTDRLIAVHIDFAVIP